MKHTDLWRAMDWLSALAQVWDIEFVKSMSKIIEREWKKNYIPKKDKELLRYLTKEEQLLYLNS